MSSSRPTSIAGAPKQSAARRVIVSLEFLPANTTVQTPLTNEFSSHLPLTDLQWKSSSRSRTIESLSLDFRPFRESVREAPPQQIPINLLERPYLHLLFVASDDNEAYRVTLRPEIRHWITALQTKKAQEWLIVHVTTQKTGPAKFYQRKGSVYDKIRADFNLGKKERVLQLPVPGSQADESAADYTSTWREFLSKVKESIVTSFDINFSSYEEDVRKIDSQRQMPGWNFCTFFIQKEGLAHSFEAMNLLEDAMLQYDELEASYYLGTKDQTLPWFSRIGGSEQGDDTLSILSSANKPYREHIMQNTITVFDFRVYLFSRQAALVSSLGQIVDLAKRAKTFIYNMTKLLRSHGGVLHRYFVEAWIFTSSLEVVDRCNALLNARKMNAAAIPDLLPLLAELIELATRQVEKLGMTFGYLPKTHPFLMSIDSLPVEEGNEEEAFDSPTHFKSTNARLKATFETEEMFDKAYRSLLDQVHDAWSGSLRGRSAAKIKGTIAALEQARHNTKESLRLYATLVRSFSETKWVSIETQILRQTSGMQSGSNDKEVQKERLLALLALLRTSMEMGSIKWSLGKPEDGPAEVAAGLMQSIRTLSQQLDKDYAAIGFPTFTVKLAGTSAMPLDDEDGTKISVIIINHLPCSLEVDEIRLKMLSMADEALWLTCGSTTLKTGTNLVDVSALITVTGSYVVDTSQIRMARIVFQYSHKGAGRMRDLPHRQGRDTLLSNHQPLLVFPHNPSSLDIAVTEGLETHLDRRRQMLITIHPGHGTLLKATLRTPGLQGRIRVHLDTADCTSDNCEVRGSTQDGTLELTPRADGPFEIAVSYEPLVQMQSMPLFINVDYYTSVRPDKKRTLRTCVHLKTALPLAVNVQDYRRDKCLLSRFAVSAEQRLPLRVKDAHIADTASYTAKAATSNRQRAVIVHRDQIGAFLFRIEPSKKQAFGAADTTISSEEQSRLRIVLTYRTLEAELRSILTSSLAETLHKSGLRNSRRLCGSIASLLLGEQKLVNRFHNLHLLDSLGSEDVQLFRDGDKPDLGSCKNHLRSFWTNEDEWARIKQAIDRICSTPLSTGFVANEPWRKVSIPFDVPSVTLFNRVSLDLPPQGSHRIRVNEPVSCTLRIGTSFAWGSAEEQERMRALCSVNAGIVPASDPKMAQETSELLPEEHNVYGRGQRMLYEVTSPDEAWLVAGKWRAEFYISTPNGGELNVPLTLFAQREGQLAVPNVTIHPMPPLLDLNSASAQLFDATKQLPTVPQMSEQDLPTCETYFENAAEHVQVIDPQASNARFWINANTGQSGPLPA